ncbi:MAG: diacylglycerol kinase family lipid kinase [Blastocatellia bacterium]|nr:diacylglycerol kinase family lipid kinase [Blastocatellia bacterium]
MEDILFIINPVSACGTTRRIWTEIREDFARLGISFTERITARAGEAAQMTREALASGTSRVIAVGGDGTLNEIVNGYLDSAGRPINPDASIALLPSGTGSDFCRSLGFKTRSCAVRAILSPNARSIDAACCEFKDGDGRDTSRFFINLASFGLGGDTVSLVNRWRGRLPGWIGGRARYLAAAVRALARYRNIPVLVRLDGERDIRIDSNLIVVANGRFAGGGMMLAPHARFDDGLFDLIFADSTTRLDVIRELPRIRRGGHLNNPKVMELRAREVSIYSDEPLAIDIDGEIAGYTPARLTVLPSVVKFAVTE